VVRIQGALNQLLGAHRVAVPTLAVAGFSDDIFDAVLAFSPGFAAPTRDADEPAFFISHGRFDRVLPIDRCSRRLVSALRRAGHRVPQAAALDGEPPMTRLTSAPPSRRGGGHVSDADQPGRHGGVYVMTVHTGCVELEVPRAGAE
jgi:hypothetical protein